MPLFWVYWFEVKKPMTGEITEVSIYAESEKIARKFYEKSYGVPAGPLLRRDRW